MKNLYHIALGAAFGFSLFWLWKGEPFAGVMLFLVWTAMLMPARES